MTRIQRILDNSNKGMGERVALSLLVKQNEKKWQNVATTHSKHQPIAKRKKKITTRLPLVAVHRLTLKPLPSLWKKQMA